MKGTWAKLIVISIAAALLFSGDAPAFDGEVYFGKTFDSTLRAYPDGGVAEYAAGIEVGHRVGRVRGYTAIDTLCDDYNGDGSFHPASVRFDIGLAVNIVDGIWVEASHMCWHPVDGGGSVEQYNMLKAVWRFGER